MWSRLRQKWKLYSLLGWKNLARVAWYRTALRLGIHPAQWRKAVPFLEEDFFVHFPPVRSLPATEIWSTEVHYFGWLREPVRVTPDWNRNVLTGGFEPTARLPWWKLSDFGLVSGDVKGLWEASRMEWVPAMAQRAAAGIEGEFERLNRWLRDWCKHHPAYHGVQWKCGQEASIRVMHLAMASLFLGDDDPSRAIERFLRIHLRRIDATLGYAIAQENNHGTSEAAALFIGGSWLLASSVEDSEASRWCKKGRRWLEERIRRLVMPDGSFSQHSTNYHRFMLDTINLCEVWRRSLQLRPFSPPFISRMQAAAAWLQMMVDEGTGEAANLGANDSARLFPIANVPVRDFRASVQLATVLFRNAVVYRKQGIWDDSLRWLKVERPETIHVPEGSQVFPDGGYAVLTMDSMRAVVRCPVYRFRPSHCDALHVDLWDDGENVLSDGGTYCYNGDDQALHFFPGTAAHNTIEFDDRDQMPRFGRFLFGEWLRPLGRLDPPRKREGFLEFSTGYRDWKGACHTRRIRLDSQSLIVDDLASGFQQKAVLRWRVPKTACLDGERQRLEGPGFFIELDADIPIARLELCDGIRSRHYGCKESCRIFEVEINQPGRLTTIYRVARRVSPATDQSTSLPISERIHSAYGTHSSGIRLT